MSGAAVTGHRLLVRGLVQGVGFRPFVWHLANDMELSGTVCNTPAGVVIELWCSRQSCAGFCQRLRDEKPNLAQIEGISVTPLDDGPGAPGFCILESTGGHAATGIVADATICPDCAREIRDPDDRRFGYAFANCTHCGPRLTIIEKIPYDRAHTSMRAFPMCAECRAEYENPEDRRFHAEPIACPVCGPRIWLEDRSGRIRNTDGNEIAHTAELLKAGKIAAIKGIGGFHLACRAGDGAAVGRLRERKARPDKPLAVMAADLAQIGEHAFVLQGEEEALTSAAAPIVLLRKRPGSALAAGVAPGHERIGSMLAYSPLHVLLLDAMAEPLVMTSANNSGEPQVIDNEQARATMFEIADAIVFHDRAIVNRADDSVVRIDRTGPSMIRRARGYAPRPLTLPRGFETGPGIVAMGGDLKSVFALTGNGQAVLSQHLGDLDEIKTSEEYGRTLALFSQMFDFIPAAIAIDSHPGYRSGQAGKAMAAERGLDVIEVQHHHAHLGACMAENGVGLDDGYPVLGVVLDGTGFGEDGSIWGGEFLVGDYRGFERVVHFDPVALPGGDRAAREPWRNGFAHLHRSFGAGFMTGDLARNEFVRWLAGKPAGPLGTMIKAGINTPLSSSAGRLFDAAAAILGICRERMSYEGQTGMELEALAVPFMDAEKAWSGLDGCFDGTVLTWAPLWRALLGDVNGGIAPGRISARFHLSLIALLSGTATRLARARGIERVALSGGVFQNSLLLEGVGEGLAARGLKVLVHQKVPANDGGLALGQAVIAMARLARS